MQADDEDLATHAGAPDGQHNATLCKLVGVHLARGEAEEAILPLALAWAGKCQPPYDEAEVRRAVVDLTAKERAKSGLALAGGSNRDDADLESLPLPRPPEWPVLGAAAYHGLAGEVVRALEPEMEADPVGVLVSLLTCFGNAACKGASFPVGETPHRANLFTCLVGETTAAKGDAWSLAESLMVRADPAWVKSCVAYGMGSGEGLAERVRDAETEQQPVKDGRGSVVRFEEAVIDPGAQDKRLLVVEEEFSKPLALMRRDDSTLSAHVRNAWGGRPLEVLNRRRNAVTGLLEGGLDVPTPGIVADDGFGAQGRVGRVEVLYASAEPTLRGMVAWELSRGGSHDAATQSRQATTLVGTRSALATLPADHSRLLRTPPLQ